jgi:hypothetical protein
MRPENIRRVHRITDAPPPVAKPPEAAAVAPAPSPARERLAQRAHFNIGGGPFETEAKETERRGPPDFAQGNAAGITVPVAVAQDGSYRLTAEQAAGLGLRPATGSRQASG